jgi:hypothetical protein
MQHPCFRVPDHHRQQGEAKGNNGINRNTVVPCLGGQAV